MYEYYASEGQNPLPYAIAELIDNALYATAENTEKRTIEVRLHFDDTTPSKNMICVIDNGKGMNPRQLNNWAVYRLSKFNRNTKDSRNKTGDESGNSDKEDADDSSQTVNAPRSLNSDISYFGVGGKQAIFFIGTATRMITKPKNSRDVHELWLSKEDFERKEKNREAIYSGVIRNRKAGDNSHINTDDEVQRQLIEEETKKPSEESFTAVLIQGINQTHVPYLKNQLKEWTRQLSHIYHYYLHGPSGNTSANDSSLTQTADGFKNTDIIVKLYTRGQAEPRVVNLREIDDDMQSLYIQTAVSSFEFKATIEGTGVVEGILRYHPFLYERETYPSDALDPRADVDADDDHDYTVSDTRPARGRRPIFECYWNGRLIPYTSIEDFEWCAMPKKSKVVPVECYNRVSGVLWTNDKFQVSTNKLTFIDLEMRLRDKQAVFSRVGGTAGHHDRRTAIDKEFLNWLKECHEQQDKQIKFCGFQGHVVRTDLPKNKQTPWAEYDSIEWDGKMFKTGQLTKIVRTVPITYGKIKRFLLYGDHEDDVFATGGDMEISQEPSALYDELKIFPLVKLDRHATQTACRKYIEEEEARLPFQLELDWPEGNAVSDGEKRPAGQTIGDIKVSILNRKGENIGKLPGTTGQQKKLLVELKIIWHAPSGDEVIVSHISQHGKSWPYWFRKMENIKNLGEHTLQLQVVLNESGANIFAGQELPSHKLTFTVTEASAQKFTVGLLDGPFRIGTTFSIPLEFQDEYNHATKPDKNNKPTLHATGLELTYEKTELRGNALIIKNIVAMGTVPISTGKNFNLIIRVPNLADDSQTLKIRMLPGPPRKLLVEPTADTIEIENYSNLEFRVAVHDVAGNITCQPKLKAVCKFTGAANIPSYSVDLSGSGQGVLTGDCIVLPKLKEPVQMKAKIDLQGLKVVPSVEKLLFIYPSTRAAGLQLFYKDNDRTLSIRPGQEIHAIAGENIRGLTFRLMDEAGRTIEMDLDVALKVRVSWTPKLLKDYVLKGLLPDIKVPNSTQDTKYCHITFIDGSGLDFSFSVVPVPGDAGILKCKCQGTNVMRLGEILSSEITITIKDKHGNEIKGLGPNDLAELEIFGEGLNVSEVERDLSELANGFVIRNIKFEGGQLGTREVSVRWRELTDYVRLQMTAGRPKSVTFPGWNLDNPWNVYADRKLTWPLIVQLIDEMGNPTTDPDSKITIIKDNALKLTPTPMPTRADSRGQANFGHMFISGKRGLYQIQAKALVGRTVLMGTKLKINIQPDATKPVNLEVQYDAPPTYIVGEPLPVFTVKIIAEDDSPMSSAQAANLTMKLWKANTYMPRPPLDAVSYSPDARHKNEKNGTFTFSEKVIPEICGGSSIMFVYQDAKYEVVSRQIALNVEPAPPAVIVPYQNIGTPTVSNTSKAASRSLIRNLKLELHDKYHNVTGSDVDGYISVEILAPDGVEDIPTFVGNTRTLQVPLQHGFANISSLTIQENSPGVDGQEFTLELKVVSNDIPKNQSVPPYTIPFLFYNDAKKQSQMAALSRERDHLVQNIRAYESVFDTNQQLIKELKILVNEATQEEQRLVKELRKLDITPDKLKDGDMVEALISVRTKERNEVMSMPRRVCAVPAAHKDPEVLGKICHLAQVEDEDAARVLSWHMSADMDCVVTHSLRKAKNIYEHTSGKQQVLPLESIYKKNLPDWNKPLPHERFRANWSPPGNPVYAREVLIFPHEPDSCKLVFGMLLGDTIILDNLDDANAYRHEIVKHTHCPTILTRSGDRIRSNGKFGGLMNKALPIEKLRGAIFGSPLPSSYHKICKQLDTLQTYHDAIVKRERAMEELHEQQTHENTPEMKAKYKEYEEAQTHLQNIEGKLGVKMSGLNTPPVNVPSAPVATPTSTTTTPPKRGRLRAATSAGTSTGPSPAKRARASLNGAENRTTPTRTSRRKSAANYK
ncbi:structural maintenance of chromosomes flexible hinge domain-containing protein 1-like [Tubulanus polymorphus]|uniref:structural maintenance of chromosomes flexible hinge domain-containing protein 1-like n=1 Tax=Tubulanus polymorphus TaxID=672921 RepID=UPI003DA69FA9